HDAHEVRELLLHRLEGNALVRLDEAADATGILLGEESLGHDDVQIDVQADRRREDQHHDHAVAQCPAERAPVPVLDASEGRRAPSCDAPRPGAMRLALQQPAAIIGVVVRDRASEMTMATDSVTANSRNSRPMMPPISRIGMNTAMSDRLIDSTV